MAFWKGIIDSVGGGLLGGVNQVVGTVFGDKKARDQATANEDIQRLKQFQAEFAPRENRTTWDSFVDGLNRLPRPVMTFGVIGLFVYCIQEPAGFAISMKALELMPTAGWALLSTIVAFWFGGKFLGGLKKPEPMSVEEVEKIIELMERRDAKREQKTEPMAEQSLADAS